MFEFQQFFEFLVYNRFYKCFLRVLKFQQFFGFLVYSRFYKCFLRVLGFQQFFEFVIYNPCHTRLLRVFFFTLTVAGFFMFRYLRVLGLSYDHFFDVYDQNVYPNWQY